MDFIFENGEKLYLKRNPVNMIENLMGNDLHSYQKQFLNKMSNQNKKDKIYGDDFLIEFNDDIVDGLVLSIKDFDESQKQETEIHISFSEKELGQFISILQHYYDTW